MDALGSHAAGARHNPGAVSGAAAIFSRSGYS